jgi:hypothetical protein
MIRRLSVLIMSAGLGLALVLAPTATSAEDEAQPNPVDQVVKTVQDLVQPKNVQTSDHADAPDPPDEDDDIAPNETENPVGPDHGSTRGLDTGIGPIGGTTLSLLGLNHNNATVNDDDTTHADSAPLKLLGSDLFGTSASATEGQNNTDSSAPAGFILDLICAFSGDNICVKALYSESHASEDEDFSHAHAASGVLNACIGGGATGDGGEEGPVLAGGGVRSAGQVATQDSEEPPSACEGLLGVGVAESYASTDRNRDTGQTQSRAYDYTLDACALPGCVIPGTLLYSFGEADSGDEGSEPSADRGSFLLALGPGVFLDEPFGLTLPFIGSLFLNQGETYLDHVEGVDGTGIAGTAQDALKINLLTDFLPIFANAGHTETLAHDRADGDNEDPDNEDPDNEDPDNEDPDNEDSDDEDSDDEDGDDRALPGTGGPSSALLAIGMLGIGLGAGTIAYGRRPRKTGAN